MQDPDTFTIGSDAYAFGDASLLPARGSSLTFTELSSLAEPLELITAAGPTAVPAPQAPTKKQAKSKAKGPHKRQISEAIPRAEREVARVPQDAVMEVPQDAAKAVDGGLRKSRVRARAGQKCS
jgi:hypothetical protein